MNERKELILNTIIREHIATGAPVGSSVLVDKYKLNISSATVRNEMAELEEEGYIAQPHTSAGRIPTERAYRLYLEKINETKIDKMSEQAINLILHEKTEASFREVAKTLSQLTNNTVFWAFHRHNLYYTGISSMFQQPEFRELETIYDISAVIDRIDEIVTETFDQIDFGTNVLLGSDSPFGNFCSTIMVKYKHDGNVGMFGILGPMRMDYERNIALVRFINELIGK